MTTTGQRRGRYAIIPTHNRQQQLEALVEALSTQVDMICVIDNASDPPVDPTRWSNAALLDYPDRRFVADHQPSDRGVVVTVRDRAQPPNLPKMWNYGFELISYWARGLHGEYDIAIVNDDAVIVPGWFDLVSTAMREHGCAAACSLASVPAPLVKLTPDGDLHRRLYGPAFIIAGELAQKPGDPMWADERLEWWFNDSDMDFRARRSGGMLIVPGPTIENTNAGSTTVGPLAEQAGRDRETFRQIWGFTW